MKIKPRIFWSWVLKDESVQAAFYFVLALVFIGMVFTKFYYHAVTLDNEFKHLAKHGRALNGKIVKFEPYLRHMFTEGGPGDPLKGIYVEIQSEDLNKTISETWDYRLKDSYHVGDTVKLYYDEENKWVKVASVNYSKKTPD